MMKKLLWLGAWLLLRSAAAQAGGVADLDREDGLPNAKIGAPLEAFRGLVQIEDTGRWLTYKDPGEKLSYGGFAVTGIKYNFFKRKLYSINLEVEGRRATRGILKTLETDFGTTHSLEKHHPAKAETDLEVREWTGQKVYLLYKSAANGAGAQITFLDRPTWDALQVPRDQRNEQYRRMMGGSFSNGDF